MIITKLIRIIPIVAILVISSCTRVSDKNNKSTLTQSAININKQTTVVHTDTSLTKPDEIKDTKRKNTANNHEKIKYPIMRMGAVPVNDNFNGLPLNEQLDLASKALKNFPDTLIHLAKEYYSGYDRYFPKSIQDDFEKGISTEQIFYPTLIFRFQVFENEFAEIPYLDKLITIKRERNGTLTAE